MSRSKDRRAEVKPGQLETVEVVEAERLSSQSHATSMIDRVRRERETEELDSANYLRRCRANILAGRLARDVEGYSRKG